MMWARSCPCMRGLTLAELALVELALVERGLFSLGSFNRRDAPL